MQKSVENVNNSLLMDLWPSIMSNFLVESVEKREKGGKQNTFSRRAGWPFGFFKAGKYKYTLFPAIQLVMRE